MKPWHKVRRWLVALFVCTHLSVLLTYNVLQLIPSDEPEVLRKATNRAMHAAGIAQRWDMFAPNVGTGAHAPVLVLYFADGTFEFVHSPSTPQLIHAVPNQLQIHKLPPEQRACRWNYHLVDGRARKFESHVCKPGFIAMPIRTAWTRWMLRQWLAGNPGRGKDLRFVQFARAWVVYDDEGPVPRIDSVTMMQIDPKQDSQWPLPGVKQFPGVQP